MSSPVRKLEPVTELKPQPMVAIDDVTMAFGSFVAVQNVNLRVGDGEFLSIVGPTGCGKSTILNAIAGLLKPAQGKVSIDGTAVQGVQNTIGYLFQQDALLPWKTAFQNVELGLMFRGVAEDERRAKVTAWLERSASRASETVFRTSSRVGSANACRWRRRSSPSRRSS